jgi:S1-C subfamily serine protease
MSQHHEGPNQEQPEEKAPAAGSVPWFRQDPGHGVPPTAPMSGGGDDAYAPPPSAGGLSAPPAASAGGPSEPPRWGPLAPPPWDQPPWDQPAWGRARPAGRVRRRRTRPVAAAALLAGTFAASAAVTHELWPAANHSVATGSTSNPISGGNLPGSGSGPSSPFGSGSGPTSGSSSSTGMGAPANVSAIASKASPALVVINTTFRYQEAKGAGTGIVLTSTGEILTNNHVIDGATSIRVTDMGNGKTYKASVVGYDKSDDVAVLQLTGASGLQTASVASTAAKVGDGVVAVGNAGGTGSMTAAGGSVTALNQAITASDQLDGVSENLTGLIETNANVQAGDSGGALVNSSGQVVGMDTAAAEGYSLSQFGTGNQGYAIPINKALNVAQAIEAGQSSSTIHVGPTPFLGVLIASNQQNAGGFGSPGATVDGAGVAGVIAGGSAASAGLAQGDVITGLDGHTISTPSDLSALVATLRPGQTVQLTYTDTSGTSHTVAVTLQTGPPA